MKKPGQKPEIPVLLQLLAQSYMSFTSNAANGHHDALVDQKQHTRTSQEVVFPHHVASNEHIIGIAYTTYIGKVNKLGQPERTHTLALPQQGRTQQRNKLQNSLVFPNRTVVGTTHAAASCLSNTPSFCRLYKLLQQLLAGVSKHVCLQSLTAVTVSNTASLDIRNAASTCTLCWPLAANSSRSVISHCEAQLHNH